MGAQQPLRLRRQGEVGARLPAEGVDEQEQILLPLPQGRDEGGQGVEPVVQILAEGALLHPLFQILVGGRHDAHVHRDDLVASHPHDLPLLEDPQQLALQGGTHPLHLVQEEGALVGKLEQAGLSPPPGPGEGPLLIAEQLALQQVFRHGGAVDGHKGPPRAGGGVVDGVGEDFLAGARLADEQDGQRGEGHLFQNSHTPADGRGAPHHIVKGILGPVALVEQLGAQLVLPVLRVGEALHRGEGADALAPPEHRGHRHVEVDAPRAHHPGGLGRPLGQALFKGQEGIDLPGGAVQGPPAGDAGDLLQLAVAGKDLPLLVHPGDALVQDLHEDLKLALQPQPPGKHLVKAVGVGGHLPLVGLEGRPLQQVLQPQAQGGLDHGGAVAHPLADVDDGPGPPGDIAGLLGGDDIVVFVHIRLRRAGMVEVKGQLVHPQLVEAAHRLPAHLVAEVDEQHPLSGGQGLKPADHLPAEGDMDLHDLPVQRDIPVHIPQGVKGVGGDHVQVKPPGHVLHRAVPHAVGAHLHPLPKELPDLLGVKSAGIGVQGHHRHLLLHRCPSSKVVKQFPLFSSYFDLF